MRRTHLPLVLLLALSCRTVAAATDGIHPYLTSAHTLGVGVNYQQSDSELRATRGNLPEVSVDLRDLGVDDTDTNWMAEYRWRFAERWMLVGVAYAFDQSGGRTLQRDFNFDGKEFEAGASVDASLDFDTYFVDVLYSVYRSERAELMLGGGLHAVDVEASIEGRAFVGDREVESTTATADLLAPLPNLRAQGFYALNERWGLYAVAGWLSADYGDYDGSFAYAHARLMYTFGNHLGVSLGYQFADLDVTYTPSSSRETQLDVQFDGPTLVLNYSF